MPSKTVLRPIDTILGHAGRGRGILVAGVGGSGDPWRIWEEMGVREREREREREKEKKSVVFVSK